MTIEKSIFYVVHITFENLINAKEVSEIALFKFQVDGIEEFSIDEAEIDEILGERAYSGGDIPQDVILEVEQETTERNDLCYKFFFYDGDLARSEDFYTYVKENYSKCEVKIEESEVKDWNAEWKKHYAPIIVTDELSVIPEWYKEENFKDDNTKIHINPGMGFGTGEHETTFLCLKLMENIREKLQVEGLCLDFGCGSGILGIGAIKKINMQVDFVDVDTAALDNCHENLKLNFNQDKLKGHSLVGRDRFKLSGQYDFVFANILEHVLILEKQLLLDSLRSGAYLVLSGILNHQVDKIREEYSSLLEVDVISKGDWSAIMFKAL